MLFGLPSVKGNSDRRQFGTVSGIQLSTTNFMIRSLPCSPPPSCSDQPTSEDGAHTTSERQKNKEKERRTALFTTETSSKRCAHVSLLDGWMGGHLVLSDGCSSCHAWLRNSSLGPQGANIPTATASCTKIECAARAQSLDVRI